MLHLENEIYMWINCHMEGKDGFLWWKHMLPVNYFIWVPKVPVDIHSFRAFWKVNSNIYNDFYIEEDRKV